MNCLTSLKSKRQLKSDKAELVRWKLDLIKSLKLCVYRMKKQDKINHNRIIKIATRVASVSKHI